MSGSPGTDIDLQAVLARINRDLAESAKLREESNKFNAEQRKLLAEQVKLTAEARKFEWDRGVQTLLAITGLIGGIITVVRLLFQGRTP